MLVALGGLAFVLAAAVQLVAYSLVLRGALRSMEADVRRRGLGRWVVLVLAWQALMILGIALYAIFLPPSLRGGFAWVAPPLGLVVGTALPLQLAVMALTRSLRV